MSLENAISSLPEAKRFECKLCGAPVVIVSYRPAYKIADLTNSKRWIADTMRNEMLCLVCSIEKYKKFFFSDAQEGKGEGEESRRCDEC